jgi:hypothetical protein
VVAALVNVLDRVRALRFHPACQAVEREGPAGDPE